MLVKRYGHPMRLIDELFEDLAKMQVEDIDYKVPVHDIIENNDGYIIEMLLAGVKKGDISLEVENDQLTIIAERKINEEAKYNRKQSYFGKYKRMFVLPDDVDKEKIDASLSDGVLIVKIPKTESKKLIKSTIKIK